MLNNLLVKSLTLLISYLLVNVNISTAKEKEVFETPKRLNTYGMPGSIDTPSAEVFPEGQFSVSSSIFGGTIRTNLSFQVTSGVTLSFRYARIPSSMGDHRGYFWDRSFDFHYLFNKQTNYLTSIQKQTNAFTDAWNSHETPATRAMSLAKPPFRKAHRVHRSFATPRVFELAKFQTAAI